MADSESAVICITMKTCKYCLAPVVSLASCKCGEYKKDLARKHASKVNSYYSRHPLRRLVKGLENQRRKLRKVKVDITPWDLWKMAKKQRMLCALSGRKLTSDNISLDHILPLSKGGTNNISNLRLVKKEVNFARQTLSDTDFFNLCREILQHCNK